MSNRKPETVSVIRSWDDLTITAFWDCRDENINKGKWLNIKSVRTSLDGDTVIKCIRLDKDEAEHLAAVIEAGIIKAGVRK